MTGPAARDFDVLGSLEPYTSLGPGASTLDNVYTILERYNLPWLLEDSYAADYPPFRHYEPVPEDDAFGEHLRGLYRRPFFYRLAFLRQLSTVAITRHLDATHSRLSHALGVVKIARRMLARIFHQRPEAARNELANVACLFYCFLHDCFHGPMGHSLDMMKDVFDPTLVEKLDDGYLRNCLDRILAPKDAADRADLVANSVLAAAESCLPGQGREVIDMVKTLSMPDRLRTTASQSYFLRDIVDSVLDADRLDYLLRDARILGGSVEDLPPLIGRVRVVDEDGLLRLAFPLEDEGSVATALGLRRKLYAQYYEHPDKLIVDDMICHGLHYVLSDRNVLSPQVDPATERKRLQVLQSVMFLTDDDFFPALGELRAAAQCYDLLIRVRQHNYFVNVRTWFLTLKGLPGTIDGFGKWMLALDSWADSVAERRGAARYVDVRSKDDVDEVRRVSEPFVGQQDQLAYAFQFATRGRFLARLAFERAVWARFCAADAGGKARQSYLAKQYGHVDYCDLSLLDQFPPLHITTTSSFKLRSKTDIEFHSKEGFETHKVLFYSKEVGGDFKAVLPRRTVATEIEEEHRAFPLVVSAPLALVAAAGVEQLQRVVEEELRSCGWLWEFLASGQALPVPQAPRE